MRNCILRTFSTYPEFICYHCYQLSPFGDFNPELPSWPPAQQGSCLVPRAKFSSDARADRKQLSVQMFFQCPRQWTLCVLSLISREIATGCYWAYMSWQLFFKRQQEAIEEMAGERVGWSSSLVSAKVRNWRLGEGTILQQAVILRHWTSP